MNRKTFIQQGIFFLLFSIFLAKCFSVNVEYYGVNSTSSDREKITMTQDLLYTKLLKIDLHLTSCCRLSCMLFNV